MQFEHPRMFWLFAVTVPTLSLFLWWSWRRRQFLISQFVRSRLLAHLTVGLSRRVQKFRLVLLVIGVGLLIITLAQPQWGFAWEQATQRGLDIVLAIDTSRSMLAEDIAPSRLERAKLAALDLMQLAKRDRLGLVAFAGTAFLQCPLTLDDEAFRQSVNQLSVGIIPQGGTALAEAIEAAQSAFKDDGDNHRVLIFFTDGEDHDSDALAAAEKAAKSGLRIFTVGVGTSNGELLRQKDEQGSGSYLKDAEGNVVKSRLNENLLTQIATAGNGFYLPMTGVNPMEVLYQRGLASLPRSEISSRVVKQFRDRYQWPLALAILCLITEVFLPERKKVPRQEAPARGGLPELQKLIGLLLISQTCLTTLASSATALRKYEAGQFKDSYQEYTRLLRQHPDDPRLQYNAGTAAYQAKKFEEATKHFSGATTAPDLKLQQQAYYNLGNALFRQGEAEVSLPKKSELWDQSAKEYESALRLEPTDPDAKFNLEFVRRKLEDLKQEQEKQKQQQPSPDQKNDQDKEPGEDKEKKEQPQEKKNSDSKPDPKDPEKQKQPEQDAKPEPSQQPEQDKEKQDQSQKQKKPDPGKDDGQGKDEQSGGKQDPGTSTNSMDGASASMAGRMSMEQVKQLLDTQKEHEKAMIFVPTDKQKAKGRVFKDW